MNFLRSILMEGAGDAGAGNGGGSLLGGAGDGAVAGAGAGSGAPAFTPSYEGVFDSKTGSFAENWHTKAFGPEYNGPLAGVKDLTSVDKMLRDNIAAARGQLEWPGEKATPEQIARIRKLTGAPETPDKYGDLRPETIPAELWDKGSEAKLQAIAHKHHLPPSALKEVVGLYAESLGEAVKQNEAATQTNRAAEMTRLKTEFGKDFDASLFGAKRVALTLGMDVEKDPIFQNASAVIMLSKMAKLMGEDKLINGATQGLTGTPMMQANDIMTNTANPHYAKYQAGDKDTVNLVNNLLAQSTK